MTKSGHNYVLFIIFDIRIWMTTCIQPSIHDLHATNSAEETILQDFQVFMKHLLQNY